jgi:transposase
MKITSLQMRKTAQLILGPALSNRKIAALTKVSPNTVKRYRKLLNTKSLSVTDIKNMCDSDIINILKARNAIIHRKRIPDWEMVHAKMQRKHQVLLEMWEDYVLIDPTDAYSYSQFTYYYRKFTAKLDITMRQNHIAGEVVFSDFCGKRIGYKNKDLVRELYAEIFVACLGCSNYTFAYAVSSQKIPHWIESHNIMFQFFGGVPQVEVPDNLKSAVNKPGHFPELNRTFSDMAEHYNIAIIPSRVRKPQDKSKAENAVRLVTRWIINRLQQETFFSVAEINVRISELLEVFNNRAFKRLPGTRKSRFYEFDKPMLQPLPAKPFEYAEWITKQKVGPDYHVYVFNHAYSVPYQLISESVEARASTKTIEFFFNGKRVATHVRSFEEGLHTTNSEHRPAKHKAYAEQNADNFMRWAESIGPMAKRIVLAQFLGRPEFSYIGRSACGQLKSLARQYGDQRFEGACSRANDIDSLTVKSVRSILQHRLDLAIRDELPIQSQIPLHHNVRGSDYFQIGGIQ